MRCKRWGPVTWPFRRRSCSSEENLYCQAKSARLVIFGGQLAAGRGWGAGWAWTAFWFGWAAGLEPSILGRPARLNVKLGAFEFWVPRALRWHDRVFASSELWQFASNIFVWGGHSVVTPSTLACCNQGMIMIRSRLNLGAHTLTTPELQKRRCWCVRWMCFPATVSG